MSRGPRLAGNGLFCLVYLGGAWLVWVGLRELVFGSTHIVSGLLTMLAGFAVWIALASLSRRLARAGEQP